jgi:hypothetical protein
MSHNRTTEPCNPYVTEVPPGHKAHRPYVDIVSYAARKAGVRRPVTVARGGVVPCHLEVRARADEAGSLMVFVINHDAVSATYQVTVDPARIPKGAEAWDLLRARRIEADTDGRFDLQLPAWQTAVLLVGAPQAHAAAKAAQAKLNAMDLSVPRYFRDRPHLNTPEYNTPIPPIGE